MKNLFFVLLTLLSSSSLLAQQNPPAGRVVVTYLDSKVLARNPGGENPRRRVSVYLPAGYEANPQQRYPVLYYLHGFTWNDSLIFHKDGMKALLDQAIADKQIRPFILVVPNEQTRFGGSWYANSATNGAWGDFTARELIAFIDGQFRTLARPGSRGLAGHSMGGGGTLRLALRYPGTWAAAYALSPALVGPHPSYLPGPGLPQALQADSPAGLTGNHAAQSTVAVSRAFSPNPSARPFGADLPGSLKADSLVRRDAALARWIASTPTYLLPTHTASLRQLRALAFDWGRRTKYATSLPPAAPSVSGFGPSGFAIQPRSMRARMVAASWARKDESTSTSCRFSTSTWIFNPKLTQLFSTSADAARQGGRWLRLPGPGRKLSWGQGLQARYAPRSTVEYSPRSRVF
ncbi:alpha/beta hydrolase [Hymenobacter cellulosilyticus]|uniref:Alpha/beta hydrolase-fold protein n=1 Tax=Hymenobacter cellulosilyticus TaxID=2932248 RepID=A0A8T9Q1D2_9BACT|nr:alpha/beta hydrolase-fold protein [Hymenobacter cellulosilyticus]UOQ71556.1 alpha/beta hydrolase-fold protein [Hymenobacter cellulosilyticus]